MKIFYISLLTVFFFLIQQEFPVYSDTVKLTDGSVLVGKIISEDKEKITVSNTYGTFDIKRNNISALYKTKVYTEDLKVLKKLKVKVKVNEEGIRKDIEAGQKKKDEMNEKLSQQKKEPDGTWTNGIVSFSGSFNYVLDEVSDKIPFGYSGHFAFDQGMDMITGERYMTMPGLRLEGGYLFFRKGNYNISGYNSALGLIWLMPLINNKYGYFVLAALPGMSFIEIENREAGRKIRSNTFTGSAIAGYRLPLAGSFQLFLHARYMYIYDKDVRFHTIGAEFGFGYKLW
jgi:hypothetical protein